MPFYDGISEQCSMQRIPLSQFQDSTALMQYYAKLLYRHDHEQLLRAAVPKSVNEVYSSAKKDGMMSSKEDEFMMYNFKVRRCPTGRGHHDWTDCQYLHPGEKARRRDPRKYSYSGKPCANFRKHGQCENGDKCHFAHGVFETWLHPDKYKTQLCRDGANCNRKVCFFAHSKEEMREGDGVIQDMNNLVSPKSVLDEHQSPPLSPPVSPTNDVMKNFERLRLSSVQNIPYSAQNTAHGVIGRDHTNYNFIRFKPQPMKIEAVEEPDLDWIVQLVG